MFNLPHYSMALNSHNVPPPDFKLFNSYKVGKETPVSHILAWTAKVADEIDGGLRCLVINCHGDPGALHLGTGILPPHASMFKVLRGKVNTILITACSVASASAGCSVLFDGNLFCGAIAKFSGATVFCSSALQTPGMHELIGLPAGCIDEYEGVVYRYNPDGACKAVSNDQIRSHIRKLRLGL